MDSFQKCFFEWLRVVFLEYLGCFSVPGVKLSRWLVDCLICSVTICEGDGVLSTARGFIRGRLWVNRRPGAVSVINCRRGSFIGRVTTGWK